MESLITALIVLLAPFVVILLASIRIVKEYDRLVILLLGRYQGTKGPGVVIVIPVLQRAIKVDLRENFLDIPHQTAITLDNAPIAIDFLVYYRIVDPTLAVLKVDNVIRASTNIATTTLRAVIGDISLDDVLSKREQINDILQMKLDEVTERWGLKVTSVEIREIQPPREVQDAMNRQMSAERDRRAMVTKANGEREAAITRAEGEKQAAILKAEGQRQATILQAEGEQEAQRLRALGYAKALEAIYQTAKEVDANTMALQYLDAVRVVGSSPATKFVVPMELVNFAQQFMQTAGVNSHREAPPANTPPA